MDTLNYRMSEISPSEGSKWLRQQAARLIAAADAMDATAAILQKMGTSATNLSENKPPPTADTIRQMLDKEGKSLRVGAIAKKLGIEEPEVYAMVLEANSGMEAGEKGWINRV